MISKQHEEYTITSLSDFLKNLPESRVEVPWGYRGQVNSEWKLIPSLFRNLIDISETLDGIKKAWTLKNLEQILLRKFKEYALPHLPTIPNCDLAWLALGQHHGLPTRLLDWTENPLVALFFAVKEEVEHNAVVWAFSTTHVLIENERTLEALDKELLMSKKSKKDFSYLDNDDLTKPIYRYHPSHTTNRITAQQGFFSIQSFWNATTGSLQLQSLEEQFGLYPDRYEGVSGIDDPWGPWFKKYIVPVQYKLTIRRELDVLGMNHYAIFPDLEGLAKKLCEDVKLKKIF